MIDRDYLFMVLELGSFWFLNFTLLLLVFVGMSMKRKDMIVADYLFERGWRRKELIVADLLFERGN